MSVTNSGLGVAPGIAQAERRRHARVRIIDRRLVTVNLDKKDAGLIIDLSEGGMAVQALSKVREGATTTMQFELPETKSRIEASGIVAWVDDSAGRAGIRFLQLSDSTRTMLSSWLSRDRAAPAPVTIAAADSSRTVSPDVLRLQREIERHKLDADAAWALIVKDAMSLTQATGAAIALSDGQGIVCCASAGAAPQVGARLNPDSGLSGECVRTGVIVRCEDTELDPRVDREACRQLDVRSAIMVPLFSVAKVVGLLEVFSSTHHAFQGRDVLSLRRLADLIAATLNPGSSVTAIPPLPPPIEPVPAPPLPQRRTMGSAAAVRSEARPATLICDACGYLNPASNRECEKCDVPLRAVTEKDRAGAGTATVPLVTEQLVPAAPLFGGLLEEEEKAPARRVAQFVRRPWFLVMVAILLSAAGAGGWLYWKKVHAPIPPLPAPAVVEPGGEQPKGSQLAPAEQQPAQAPPQSTNAPPQGPAEVKAKLTTREAADPEVVVKRISPAPQERRLPSTKPSDSASVLTLPPSLPPAPPELAKPADGGLVATILTPPVVSPLLTPPVSSGLVPARLVRKVEPSYPKTGVGYRLAGAVVLKARITDRGAVQDVRIESGNQILAVAAVQAVRQWRYLPQMLNGKPVEVETTITINFNLKDR